MRPFIVYIIECGDGSFYVGQTDDLERRWDEHESGAIPSCYTNSRHPLRLVFSNELGTRVEAIEMERRIKNWSRAKKIALLRGGVGAVRELGHPDHRALPKSVE